MKLTREAFAAPPDLPRKSVTVPELNGTATLRRMTAGERSQYQTALFRFGENGDRQIILEHADIRLVVLTLIDPDTGERLYPDVDEGIRVLGGQDAAVVDRLVVTARELNPLTREEVEEAVEDLSETAS